MNELFDKMVKQVLAYKPPPKEKRSKQEKPKQEKPKQEEKQKKHTD